MSITFKQYSEFEEAAALCESLEQLDEIFGKFFGKDQDRQKDILIKKREEFQKRKEAEEERKKKLLKTRDDAFARAKERMENRPGVARKTGPEGSGGHSAAQRGRSAERDWVSNLS